MLTGSTKLSRKKNLILFLLFIVLSGKLGPIFKVPCSNKFHFWHYCLFCSRTQILSIIWSTGNNFVLPWPLWESSLKLSSYTVRDIRQNYLVMICMGLVIVVHREQLQGHRTSFRTNLISDTTEVNRKDNPSKKEVSGVKPGKSDIKCDISDKCRMGVSGWGGQH
jgi:hypothetical protein